MAAAMVAKAETTPLPFTPAGEWTVEARADDQIALEGQDGILSVRYDVNVDSTHQIGHQTFKQVSFRLLLKQPVPLAEDERRILFEAAGFGGNQPSIAPIIVDEQGERLIYSPNTFPHLKHGGPGWGLWMSSDFFGGEAGGATQDVYEAEGGDGNAWPDGKLAFVGFQFNIRPPLHKPEFGRRQGIFHLGQISRGGVRLPAQPPFAYADGFLKEAGKYRLAAAIRNDFQAVPIREIERQIPFDPADIASCRQRIEFPLGPVDNYWIDYQITAEDGKVVAANGMRYQVIESVDSAVPQPVDVSIPPALGRLRINSRHPGRGVYRRGEALTVQVRVFPKGADKLELKWKLTPWRYGTALDEGATTVAFADKQPFADLVINPKPQAGSDAYKLHLTVKHGDKTVDSQTYCLGYETDLTQSHDRAGHMTNRHEVKKHTYNRTTYIKADGVTFTSEADELANFRDCLTNAKQIADNLTYMVDLARFEVLPGVFDFALLDGIMDAAADYGCKVTVRLAHADQDKDGGPYPWLKYDRQYSYDGTEIQQHFYGAYAVTDPRTIKLWLDAYQAVFSRYNRHTAFQGYFIMQPGGEWTVVDKPWEGRIADYSPASANGFRAYMQTNLGLDLPQVNQRWNTNYQSWDDLQPPQPALRLGAKPDLRMQWVDFNRFKRALDTEIWMPLAVNSIRAYDDHRITIAYGSPHNMKRLHGRLDYCHNGGNHYGNFLGQFVTAWEQGGIGWITEPHQPHRWAAYGDPAGKGWVLDWSVWVMIAQAGGGGANLHVYFCPNPTLDLAPHYGGVFSYDRMQKYAPILEELVSLKLRNPPIEVAALQDPYTLYTKHRTVFESRLDDLKRWFELLKADAVGHDELQSLSVENGSKYKLILPNALDEVMSHANIEAVDALVRHGAKMIMTANTGSYCPEYGNEPFQLLGKLGIAAPVGPYVQDRLAVVAVAATGNPLFPVNAPVPFFSLADLQADLQSDGVKKDFWKYPYRWIPQTDYFGHYPDNKQTNGEVLATFAGGGVAMSLHKVGRGEVIVFWGTPDMRDDKLKGLMQRAAVWADAVSPRHGSPIPNTIEGHSDKLNRHYALLYQETVGTYTQKLITVPDGEWFLDDMVSGQKLGLYTGQELRENGLELTFVGGYSPLKVIRMLPKGQDKPGWVEKYRTIPEGAKAK